ncbi:phosphotransferase [Streptomyces sp. 21So2-11]|uniref:phosphotransferase enzyme family protein n=1 Tax=Streptomyces sp. 21So2-11 TaxID=3144408 RepID=UPI00321B192A
MPETVHRLVASVTRSFRIVADHSSAGDGRPVVWEVEGPDGHRWFAKLHSGPKMHRREVDAYQRGWTTALGTGRAATLMAVDGEAHAIVTTAVSGRTVHSLRLDSTEEQEVYRQAGLLLARLHTAGVGGTVSPAGDRSWGEDVEKMLASAALHLTANDVAMLRALTTDAPPDLPVLVSHADFMPRNWLWDEGERLLRLIDFERACVESPARRDLSRLGYRILRGRPDLEEALFQGYGRTLTDDERRACSAYAALDAVSALHWGLEHRDVKSVDEAHTMLRHLQAEHASHIRRETSG